MIFTKRAGVASPTPPGSRSPQPSTKPGALKSKTFFTRGKCCQVAPGQPKDDEEKEKSGNLEIETGI